MSHRAIVYYRPGCPFAIRLRVALTLRRVPFVSVRFRDDEAAAAEVREVNGGNEISPTVRIGDTYLSNPSARAVVAAAQPFHRPSTPAPADRGATTNQGRTVGPRICRFP
jgi:mycoredoxin